MKSYAEREVFSAEDVHDFRVAVRLIEAIPTPKASGEIRCHELAEAVSRVLPAWKRVDGKRGPIEHSWLRLFGRPTYVATVLDVYAPGEMPMVQLVDLFGCLDLYKPGERRTDIREAIVVELVALFEAELQKPVWMERA